MEVILVVSVVSWWCWEHGHHQPSKPIDTGHARLFQAPLVVSVAFISNFLVKKEKREKEGEERKRRRKGNGTTPPTPPNNLKIALTYCFMMINIWWRRHFGHHLHTRHTTKPTHRCSGVTHLSRSAKYPHNNLEVFL
jgi:hypothetical protein